MRCDTKYIGNFIVEAALYALITFALWLKYDEKTAVLFIMIVLAISVAIENIGIRIRDDVIYELCEEEDDTKET